MDPLLAFQQAQLAAMAAAAAGQPPQPAEQVEEEEEEEEVEEDSEAEEAASGSADEQGACPAVVAVLPAARVLLGLAALTLRLTSCLRMPTPCPGAPPNPLRPP